MQTQCSHCQKEQTVPKEYTGKNIKCFYCKKYFVVKQLIPILATHPPQAIVPLNNSAPKLASRWVVRRSTTILIAASLITISSIISFYYGYDSGHKIGRKKGFWKGGDTVIDIARTISEHQPRPKPILQSPSSANSEMPSNQPDNTPLPQPGIVTSAKWRIVDQAFDFTDISWQFNFESLITAQVWLAFNFYDSDGFLLHQCGLTTIWANVEAGKTYAFSNLTTLSNQTASEIANCDVTVKRFDF